jgi:hypothetical protein
MRMTLSELHLALQSSGIEESSYYLHGLFGSTDDSDKLAMTIIVAKYSIIFKIYYKERGEQHSIYEFNDETEACMFFYKKMTGLDYKSPVNYAGMTVNERLYESGKMDEFDKFLKTDKEKAAQILRDLLVDEPSIKKIIK